MQLKVLALTTLGLLSTLAIPTQAQVIRHPNDFFQQGRDQFERQIQELTRPVALSPEDILEIAEPTTIEETPSPFDELNNLPLDTETPKSGNGENTIPQRNQN